MSKKSVDTSRENKKFPPLGESNCRSRKEVLHSLEESLQPSSKSLLIKLIFRLRFFIVARIFRFIELLLCLIVIFFFTLPLHFALVCRKIVSGRNIFFYSKEVGGVFLFNMESRFAQNLSLFYAVFRGKFRLVGSSLSKKLEEQESSPEAGYLHRVKPGIFSLWNLRKNIRIGHEGQAATEWEYCFTRGPVQDLLLMLRAIPAFLYQSSAQVTQDSLDFLGITVANLSMNEAVSSIITAALKGTQRGIFFVNPDCLNKTFSDLDYLKILQQADQVFADGIGMVVAGKIMNTPLKNNINGTDMLPFLCELAAQKEMTLFLLGAKPGVAKAMARELTVKYKVIIAGYAHGYFDRDRQHDEIISKINTSGADILLVAFGAPSQEKWIMAHKHELSPRVFLGVGGLFDFFSGRTKRAPRWLRELGLEWLYRIIQEPGRMWYRYFIGNPLFLLRVLLWKIFQRRII